MPSKHTGDAKRSEESDRPAAGLYVTSVPIGNAGDITVRALRLLAHVDAIACEDTRSTRRLLGLHGIRPPHLIAYHDHNADHARPGILDRIAGGQAVALVSDAGTPAVSDPGYKLVRAARDRGLTVTALPGASAMLTALVLSGLPTDRFGFFGFPPPRSGARRTFLTALAAFPATLIFYESPRRLAASLTDMAAGLGDRPAAVARELTKLYEEVRSDTLSALADHYRAAGPPRGEVVIVVGPPPAAAPSAPADIDRALADALTRLSLRDAVAEVAMTFDAKRADIYRRALALKG